jgi:hypothetical protein
MQNNQDKQDIKEIIAYIKNQERILRNNHPFLAQQNALGLGLLLVSVCGFTAAVVCIFMLLFQHGVALSLAP